MVSFTSDIYIFLSLYGVYVLEKPSSGLTVYLLLFALNLCEFYMVISNIMVGKIVFKSTFERLSGVKVHITPSYHSFALSMFCVCNIRSIG